MLEYTVSGRIGKFLEPMFAPIGFDWKLTTASIGALAAKEVFVSQLGILYAEAKRTKSPKHSAKSSQKSTLPCRASA